MVESSASIAASSSSRWQLGDDHSGCGNVEAAMICSCRPRRGASPTIGRHRPGLPGMDALEWPAPSGPGRKSPRYGWSCSRRHADSTSARDVASTPVSSSRCARQCCTNAWSTSSRSAAGGVVASPGALRDAAPAESRGDILVVEDNLINHSALAYCRSRVTGQASSTTAKKRSTPARKGFRSHSDGLPHA